MAIVLLTALANARLGDSADTTATVANPADTNSNNPTATTNSTTTLSTADLINFLSGVWEAIGLGHDFDDFSACVTVNSNTGAQLQKVITLIDSSSASKVSYGLNKIEQVVSPLMDGLKTCNMSDKYSTAISQIVDQFANPTQLTVQIGVSISVNGIETYPTMTGAISACSSGDFATCGTSIGSAMGNVFYGKTNVTSASQANKINAIPNITWTAADNTAFNGLNLWQFKKSRITLLRKNNHKTSSGNSSADSEADQNRRNLATSTSAFDARTKWSTCIHPIRDQGNCGDCWAFAASEVLSDRFCIVTNKSTNTVMSPQFLVSCDNTDSACNGGSPYYSWKFLEKTGDVSDSCFPYKSSNGAVPSCSSFSRCSDGSTLRHYYAKVGSTKSFTTPSAIQTEVLANGPVEASMDVYSDFMYYSSGIYDTTPGSYYLGGHAVKIVGWGNSNGINYWIVANSWGTYWGESGYFQIQFGSSSIDSGCYAGLPDLTRQ